MGIIRVKCQVPLTLGHGSPRPPPSSQRQKSCYAPDDRLLQLTDAEEDQQRRRSTEWSPGVTRCQLPAVLSRGAVGTMRGFPAMTCDHMYEVLWAREALLSPQVQGFSWWWITRHRASAADLSRPVSSPHEGKLIQPGPGSSP